MEFLENKDIDLSILPKQDDAEAIYKFALTLECTGEYDSFKEAESDVDGKEKSLSDIRMELYFAAKTYEAIKIEEHVDIYQTYYDQIVKKVEAGDFA